MLSSREDVSHLYPFPELLSCTILLGTSSRIIGVVRSTEEYVSGGGSCRLSDTIREECSVSEQRVSFVGTSDELRDSVEIAALVNAGVDGRLMFALTNFGVRSVG